jgi:hypothetical protein
MDEYVRDVGVKTVRWLVLEIHWGKRLQNVQWFGTQDPYAAVTALPSKVSTRKTKSDVDAGTEPRWKQNHGNCMVRQTLKHSRC